MPLADLLHQFAARAADHVIDVKDANTQQQKQKKFLLLLSLLNNFGAEAKSSLESTVFSATADTQQRIIDTLPADLQRLAPITSQQYQAFGRDAVDAAAKPLAKVIAAIQAIGSMLRTGRDGLLRRLLGNSHAPVTDAKSREKLAEKIIVVRGSDGRDRSYEPRHYGNLLEDGATGAAEFGTARAMAENIGSDLVQMSGPTHKDWCDLFANKIYSLSGTDPRVYPLSIVPGDGKGKMHPQCVHVLTPIPADKFTDNELRAMSSLPREFVQLGLDSKSKLSDYTRLWLSKSPRDWGLKNENE